MSLRAGLSHHIRFHGAFAVSLAAALLAFRLPLADRILIGADLFFIVYLLVMVHAVMAFPYARLFYARAAEAGAGMGAPRDSGGLDSPATAPSRGLGASYYSFTLGMTAQTSDIAVTTTDMRRVTLAIRC